MQSNMEDKNLQSPKTNSFNNKGIKNTEIKVKQNMKFYTGNDCFRKAVDNLYVDKSMFIRKVIEDPADSVIITRPRRWGKTLNMNMLKTFLEIEVDSNGRRLIHDYDLANPILFSNLKIMQGMQIEQTNRLLNNRKDVDSLINDVSTENYPEWREIKDAVLDIKHYKDSYSDYIDRLEFIRNKYYPIKIKINEEIERIDLLNLEEKTEKEFNCLKHMGRYPVIFITFGNTVIQGEYSEDKILDEIRESVADAYKQHDYVCRKHFLELIEEHNLSAEDDKTKKKIIIIKKNIDCLFDVIHRNKIEIIDKNILRFMRYREKNVSENLTNSIYFLSDFLREHHQENVYVLIDEYDSPLNSILNHDYSNKLQDVLKSMFRKGLKSNPYLHKSVMTGILAILKVCQFSGQNNSTLYGLDDNRYAEFFGFTEVEVKELLKETLDYEDGIYKTNRVEKIKEWYNGYYIGSHTIYNPWSITRCLCSGVENPQTAIKNYWINTADTKLLKDTFNILNTRDFTEFWSKTYIQTSIDTFINIQNILQDENSFWYLAFQTGYLTKYNDYLNTYRIPNLEVYSFFVKILIPMWAQRQNFHSKFESLVMNFIECLEKYDELEELLQKEILSKLDLGEKTEADFQVLLAGAASYAYILRCENNPKTNNFNHQVFSESYVKTGGRIDNLFIPIKDSKSTTVIIHEYKKIDNCNKIEETLDNALWQIYSTQYLLKPINLYDSFYNDYNFWTTIQVRGFVFYKDNLNNKWSVKIKEYSISIDEAKIINKIFREYKNSKFLSGSNTNASRNEFLALYTVKDLDDFVSQVKNKKITDTLSKKIETVHSNKRNTDDLLDVEKDDKETKNFKRSKK